MMTATSRTTSRRTTGNAPTGATNRLANEPINTIVGYNDAINCTATAGRRVPGFVVGAITLILLMLGLAIPSANLHAQNDPCLTDTVKINTGFNYNTNTVFPIGGMTPWWRVISDPDPGTTEPRPAGVILKHPAWAFPFTNSQWISSYPSSTNILNGLYEFEYCFCLGPNAQKPSMAFDILADDSAAVFLNGNYIGSTTGGFTVPTHLATNNPQFFKPGRNCIRVRLHNIGSVAMGLDIAGYVTAPGVGLVKPNCCDSTGVITGQKFRDLNCDGKKDANEPGLAGWTIQLSNGWTTVTDVLGNYYFFNVPVGSYIVNEVNQPGWTQTYPASLTYTVAMTAGQIVSGRDFGNCQKDTCIDMSQDSHIECKPIPGSNQMGYQWTTWLRSHLAGCQTQTATVVSVLPVGVTVTPGTFTLVANTYQQVVFSISGPAAVPGTVVSIAVRTCCVLPTGEQRCCTDTIKVRLPECPTGCFQIKENFVKCISLTNGQPAYSWCFNFLNQSSFPVYYFTIVPPPGMSFSPMTIVYPSGVAPGTMSPMQCVVISGPGAVPGGYTLYASICDKQRVHCCRDSFQIKLPDCPKPIDCCKDFLKRFAQLHNSASANGAGNVGGILWAAGSGATPIGAASATLVSVTVNGAPAWGSFTSGTINGMPGTVPPAPGYPVPQDITWGPMVPVNWMGVPFNLNLQFQPMAPNRWFDVLRYCIRFRFTDKNCVTCDTVLCFSRLRFRLIKWDDVNIWTPGTSKRQGEQTLQSADGPTLSGALVGPDSAYLAINFPVPPQELGTVHYIGLTMTPADSGLTIEDGSASVAGYDLFFANGEMLAAFDAQPNSSVTFALKYNGLGSRRTARHRLVLTYTVTNPETGMPDTLSEEALVTFRRANELGGDVVTGANTNLTNVRTYAIHLRNANTSGLPVAAFGISEPGTQSGARIIGVGPTAGDKQVIVKLGRNGQTRFVGEEIGDAAVSLAPGEEHGPIYITMAGVEANTVTLGFTTYDADGQVLTNGEITLANPLSSVRGDDGATGATAMLGQSFPNPATHSATIGFSLPMSQESVSLVVTDASGRVVTRLMDNERLGAGEHAVFFDTNNLPSGTYYYTLRAGTLVETRSMTVVK